MLHLPRSERSLNCKEALMDYRKVRFLIYLGCLFLSSTHLYAQAPAKLSAGYASMSSAHLPIWMAKDTGLLAKNGLDAQIIMLTGNVPIMALVAGDTPISQIAGIGIINSALGGSGTVAAAGGGV